MLPARVERVELNPGDRVAVVGLGPIGLMLCACVADAGGRPVGVGSRPGRRKLAPAFGAELGDSLGADIVIEAAGSAGTWRLALELVRPGETVLALGGLPAEAAVPAPSYRIHYEEVTLRDVFHHAPRHARVARAFLASGAFPFARFVTHRIGLEGVAELLSNPPRDCLKAAVIP